MEFKQYDDIREFYGDTHSFLMRHEAQNLILLGNLVMGYKGVDKRGWRNPASWFMATVSDEDNLRVAALMTPPFNLTLYAADNVCDDDALICLVDGIKTTNVNVPGVMTEKTLAARFAKIFAEKHVVKFEQRIYELSQISPNIKTIGTLRPVRESDMSFLPYWFEGFRSDCSHRTFIPPDNADDYLSQIALGRSYILEVDETPVSMAASNREIQSVCGVNYVYTPPYFRHRSYAMSCVAAVSKALLERGFSKCVLYTDLANPTSNSIYQKIGYIPICDSSEISFE